MSRPPTLITAGLTGAPADVDLVVVGLGVTGAGVALDAVTRGLSVLAVDAHDLAFAPRGGPPSLCTAACATWPAAWHTRARWSAAS